jgi:hypothetical protein
MVMQNRHDGANSHEWWDDLPPAIRKRFSHKPVQEQPVASSSQEPEPEVPGAHPSVMRDLGRVAGLFLVVAIANLLFLLLALIFIFSGPPAR